jgi:threonine 3-dehydrogenase
MSTAHEMKVLIKSKPTVGLWADMQPIPDIGDDDVLIRINKTGICGTDIHIWNWDDWAQKTVPVPLVTGHEFAGEIVSMGKNVEDLEIGQRVSGEGHLIGHHSRASRAGRFHLDPETRGIGVN